MWGKKKGLKFFVFSCFLGVFLVFGLQSSQERKKYKKTRDLRSRIEEINVSKRKDQLKNKGLKSFREERERPPFENISKEVKDFFKEESLRYFERKKQPFVKGASFVNLRKLLKDSRVEFLVEESLVHLGMTHRVFPENQAYIRLLALDLAKEKARLGDLDSFEILVLRMLKNRERNRAFRGGDEDIIDLLSFWINFLGKDMVYENPRVFFKKFAYKPKDRKIFAKALAYIYPKIVWDKELSSRFLVFLEGREKA